MTPSVPRRSELTGSWFPITAGVSSIRRRPPLEMLPPICAAVGDKLAVMLDSGVRRGADILTALCLGARFVFVGRATLYGAAAGGLPGAQKAIDILRKEIDLVMGQIGCPSLDGLGPGFLLQPPAPPMRTDSARGARWRRGGSRSVGLADKGARDDDFPRLGRASNPGRRGAAMRARFIPRTIVSGRAPSRSGCSVQQPANAPAMAEAPAHPLPFKGRLAEGDASAVPPAVAMSLSERLRR